jgi:hypothetical protein
VTPDDAAVPALSPSPTPSPARAAAGGADASSTTEGSPSPRTEIVHRPEPGTLARGAWEAPTWFFWGTAAVVLVAAAAYAMARLGLTPGLTRLRKRARRAPHDTNPTRRT